MSQRPEEVRDKYLPRLRDTLEENVLEFWYPRCLDEEHGGYILGYDADGNFDGNDEKMIVTQSRMVWLFARLARAGYDEKYLDAARHGYEFLTGPMADEEFGGYYWILNREGAVDKPNKHLYGQSFVLYALSEYYRATGNETAREEAIELVELFEREAYDHEHGGFVEYFEPDWTPITTGRTYLENIEPDWSPKESDDVSLDPTMKLMNTHLHLLEAFTTFTRAIDHARGRERLTELLHILTNTVVRKGPIVCTDKYAQDWTPLLDQDAYRIVSYGHDIEAVWLTMEAARTLDVHPGLFTELYESLWEYTLEYGYDAEDGGLYFFGSFNEPASNRIKAWWVQAEVLVSALKMYELTGRDRYLDVFTETWEFLEAHQIDKAVGEWHSGVTDELEPVGRKGAMYKGAYHNGRALLECIDLLDRLPTLASNEESS